MFLADNIARWTGRGAKAYDPLVDCQEESRRTSSDAEWEPAPRHGRGVVFGGASLGYDVKNGERSTKRRDIVPHIQPVLRRRQGAQSIAR